jgi:hypothetical protein
MALNRKLTPLLAGRVINSFLPEEGTLWIVFTDGSELRIKNTASALHESFIGRTVQRVRQDGTSMTIDYDDDTSLEITLAEATSSVMLRNKDCVLEYAD